MTWGDFKAEGDKEIRDDESIWWIDVVTDVIANPNVKLEIDRNCQNEVEIHSR